jgi:hypothetical protein
VPGGREPVEDAVQGRRGGAVLVHAGERVATPSQPHHLPVCHGVRQLGPGADGQQGLVVGDSADFDQGLDHVHIGTTSREALVGNPESTAPIGVSGVG